MSEHIPELEVTPAAKAYVQEVMEDGLAVSNLILKKRFDHADIFAFIRTGAPLAIALNFRADLTYYPEYSGVLDGTYVAMLEQLTRFLSSGEERYALFEHILAKRGDAYPNEHQIKLYYFGSQVYYLIGRRDASKLDEAYIFSSSVTNFLIITLDMAGSNSNIEHRDEWSESDIELIALRAVDVYCGAYDGRGALHCRLPKLNGPDC